MMDRFAENLSFGEMTQAILFYLFIQVLPIVRFGQLFNRFNRPIRSINQKINRNKKNVG